jgi:hypothetical protein
MARPKCPEHDRHERSFRVRLKDDDAHLILALARKLDTPPAVLLRSLIRQQLTVRAQRKDDNAAA